MQSSPKNVFGVIVLLILTFGGVSAFFQLRRGDNVQQQVADTRRALREQHFKTDLAEFNFHTDSGSHSREVAMTFLGYTAGQASPADLIDFMPTVTDDTAIVIWKQDWLKSEDGNVAWNDLRGSLEENRLQLDAACDAALSGPIRFDLDASHGSAMLLRHLAPLKKLAQMLGTRTMLELHDGNNNIAFTNLLAQTRLVTTWEPEPSEISQLVRFGLVKFPFGAVWQALQTNSWTDEQLAQLQNEWTAVDFFKPLTETMSFKRAFVVADCQRERLEPLSGAISAPDFFKDAMHSPRSAFSELKYLWSRARYRSYGTYVDEKAFLLFYRDREVEMRNAVQSTNWSAMRRMPGVTNVLFFRSSYPSRLSAMMNVREMGTAFQKRGAGFLGRAAEAETRRRIIVTAIALERFHKKHDAYPQALAELSPEFIRTIPADFMDGQPLRYHQIDSGHFELYSVGLNCVDNGGKISEDTEVFGFGHPGISGTSLPQGDIIWPRPASDAEIQGKREEDARAEQLRNYVEQQRESDDEWTRSPLRQSRIHEIMKKTWSPDLDQGFFGGRPAAEYLRNAATVTNSLSLAELMAPRQVLTGREPEELTFEFPINYDAITNHGFFLLLDADTDPRSMFAPDSGAKVQELSRATNGDCLLTWHTIFDPPGDHAVQTELTWNNEGGAETWCFGPALMVTTSNLCQFSFDSSTYTVQLGALFHARLPEKNGTYSIECLTTNGVHLKTLTGSTTNGEFKVVWNLIADDGSRLAGETFNSVVKISLADSGRTQTLHGP